MRKARGFDVPDGIIAYLTKQSGGNVHECKIVEVTTGSFEKEGGWPGGALKNVVDMEVNSFFWSQYRRLDQDISHTRTSWICYDFKAKRIVPSHYAVRTNDNGSGGQHLKSWLVETSDDGTTWREVDHKENNDDLNGSSLTGRFAISGGGACRFIRLVNIGRCHQGHDILFISAWEVFGTLLD
jgi:hypothetical protein